MIDRIVVRSALTFPLPDAFDFDVRKRAAYRWKAENLTFPTVCGTSLYVNSKGVKIWGKVGRKIVILLMLRGLSGCYFFAHPLRHLHFFLLSHLCIFIFLIKISTVVFGDVVVVAAVVVDNTLLPLSK